MEIQNSLYEFSKILDLLGDDYKNMLPSNFIEYVENNKSENYEFNISEENYESVSLSKDTLKLIALVNLNFWEKDENEKIRLLSIYKYNDNKFQEKINSFRNDENWLKVESKNSNEKNIEENDDFVNTEKLDLNEESENNIKEENSLILENNIFFKIKKCIKNFINKCKEYVWKK